MLRLNCRLSRARPFQGKLVFFYVLILSRWGVIGIHTAEESFSVLFVISTAHGADGRQGSQLMFLCRIVRPRKAVEVGEVKRDGHKTCWSSPAGRQVVGPLRNSRFFRVIMRCAGSSSAGGDPGIGN